MSMASWGNALYAGEKSYPFIKNRKVWFATGAVVILISILLIAADLSLLSCTYKPPSSSSRTT